MRKIKTVILTMAVIAGMLASVGSMTTKAANTYTIASVNKVGDVELIKQNDIMVAPDAVSYIGNKITPVVGDIVWCIYDQAEYCYLEYDGISPLSGWDTPTCNYAALSGIFAGATHNYILGVNNPAIGGVTVTATTSAEHKHSYTWTTIQEATADQDGMEEYKCSCGDVQERSVIPYTTYTVRGLYDAVKDTPINGTAAYDTKKLYCITDHIIKKMAERSDVTTVVTFQYNGVKYQMTVPAGTDFTSVLADEDYFYGYFGFAAKVGAAIIEVQ